MVRWLSVFGRYETTLDAPDSVAGYQRIERYRRSDTTRQDGLE